MNTLNSKTNESNKFIYQFTDKLDLKNLNKNMALTILSIYYTLKYIKSEYNNSKFKIHAPTWNDTFSLDDGSYSIDYPTYKIILSISSKNMKLLQITLLYKFM